MAFKDKRAIVGIAAALLLAWAACSGAALADELCGPSNPVENPSFEAGLSGWRWQDSKADARCAVEATDCHSGRYAVRLTNRSAFAPFVYGSLIQSVSGLKSETDYELDLWVRSRNACNAWVGGGPGWAVRQGLPVNCAEWSKQAVDFRTGKDQTTWEIAINVDGPADELLIDDVSIGESAQRRVWVYPPILRPETSPQAPRCIALRPGSYDPASFDNRENIEGVASFNSPIAPNSVNLELQIQSADGPGVSLAAVPLPASGSAARVSVPFSLPASALPLGAGLLVLRRNGLSEPLARTAVLRRDIAQMIPARARALSDRLESVERATRQRGADLNPYVALGIEIAQRFVRRTLSPKCAALQDDSWTWLQLRETDSVLDATDNMIRCGAPTIPPAPMESLRIADGLFETANGKPEFLGGYGAWEDALRDSRGCFPALGASLIQQEMGPNKLGPDGSDNGNMDKLRWRFEAARSAGVRIDLLLSPHYFPEWAYKQASDIALDNPGYIKFDIDHPIARSVIDRWLKTVVPAVAGEPNLFAFCLSNEPVYTGSGRSRYSRPFWTSFLESRHGTIATLNGLYGTHYAAFEDVPPPPSDVPPLTAPVGSLRAYYDWATFNSLHLAEWHRWMNATVKRLAPGVPTHAKIMLVSAFERAHMFQGVDPEQFCEITDIAGNDDTAMPPGVYWQQTPGSPHYAYGWQTEEMTYDLIRSFRSQPVFNSENHFIPDRYPNPVSPKYVRTVMWQGALHGLGATVAWVWAEEKNRKSDLYASIYMRPADIWGAGMAWLDERRCARQVAAAVRARPRIAILYSRSSLLWQANYPTTLRAAYSALTFLGEPVTFVSEKQLAEGRKPAVDVIVLPQATHVPADAARSLALFAARGGKLVGLGDGNLSCDQYARPQVPFKGIKIQKLPMSNDERVLFSEFLAVSRDLRIQNALVDSATGQPIYGIEYRFVHDQGRGYLSAVNMSDETKTVRFLYGRTEKATDMLSGESVEMRAIQLRPMEPRLIDVGADR